MCSELESRLELLDWWFDSAGEAQRASIGRGTAAGSQHSWGHSHDSRGTDSGTAGEADAY